MCWCIKLVSYIDDSYHYQFPDRNLVGARNKKTSMTLKETKVEQIKITSVCAIIYLAICLFKPRLIW